MAIAEMAKVLLVCHRSQASDLLKALQREGICQLLRAEDASLGKVYPELSQGTWRPKDIEQTLARLDRVIGLLKGYAKPTGSMLAPLVVIDQPSYTEVVRDRDMLKIVEQAERLDTSIEKTKAEIDTLQAAIEMLMPWRSLDGPVEELGRLDHVTCWTGLVPVQLADEAQSKIAELGGAVQKTATVGNKQAWLIISLNEQAEEVHKVLRAADFEAVSFEGMTGTVHELLEQRREQLTKAQKQLAEDTAELASLAKHLLQLQILSDHYANLLNREQTRSGAATTEQTVILEGWVKEHHYRQLEKVVSGFGAASVARIEPEEGEEPPVEIENTAAVRPFESITRLYGMPLPSSVDPTVFLAPFFAIFFGLCVADAAYGLIMVAVIALILRKMQGNKGIMVMLLMCSVTTVIAGAVTGSWFSDSITSLIPAESGAFTVLDGFRRKLTLFDPMTQPMVFFALALGLGYIQIQFGLFVAFFANLLKKDVVAAICDQLTWIVMLNCLLGLGLSKGGVLPASLAKVFGITALVPAVTILLFSGRDMPPAGRLGMGVFNLFSTVFYGGDILSYVRLMALGMVGSGFGMAINVLVTLVKDAPYVGWLLGALVFVGGHLFNIGMSMLGAFVHTLRLQFVEFFPKFFQGGGSQFIPLRNDYRYVYIKE
jgi:V/A-type H+-transporting ATPase subunit I